MCAPSRHRCTNGLPTTPPAHTLAYLGAVDAAIAAAEATLEAAARHVDADPRDRTGTAELTRGEPAPVETAVDEAITRTSRALGPGPRARTPSMPNGLPI